MHFEIKTQVYFSKNLYAGQPKLLCILQSKQRIPFQVIVCLPENCEHKSKELGQLDFKQ